MNEGSYFLNNGIIGEEEIIVRIPLLFLSFRAYLFMDFYNHALGNFVFMPFYALCNHA